ncbi:unnamed protein product [Menidia menidia]|uniref:(Atlantic silverside) hypothetical protein n=1 Tax=Menidia menidia TaxID=238744 RepID=A0A8S4B4X1_9TELE|nr:unnamed protein product [Menidia menidia]
MAQAQRRAPPAAHPTRETDFRKTKFGRKLEQRFHMCDRMAIYFFIAASYSPWLMLRELGPWACHMRWLIWVMAGLGSTYVFFFHERYKLIELLGYVSMGAIPALLNEPIIRQQPATAPHPHLPSDTPQGERAGVCELALGGVFYAVGVAFFKSDGLVPFAHAIWHLFVAAGAGVHYYAIWSHLYLPGPLLHTSRITSRKKQTRPVSLRVCEAGEEPELQRHAQVAVTVPLRGGDVSGRGQDALSHAGGLQQRPQLLPSGHYGSEVLLIGAPGHRPASAHRPQLGQE